ncbi:MAG: hypothetical protein DSZ30_03025 [Aquificaceae bacterium]|nr:MAG: hypothetical protein DSZ30_03025 [Aquificaceae bacterium]
MRKFLLGLLTLGVFSLSLSAQRLCETHYYIVEPVKLMPVLLKHYKELGLSPEQRLKIKEEIRFLKEKILPLNRAIDKLSKKVREDMLHSDNRLLVEGELRILANLKVEKSLYNYKCIRFLKETLTEEQFKKLLELAGY